MQGSILHFDEGTGTGVIRAEDGNRYQFVMAQYRSAGAPVAGKRVDFDVVGDVGTEIYDIPEFASVAPLSPPMADEESASPYVEAEEDVHSGSNLKWVALAIAALVAAVVGSWFLFAGPKINGVSGNAVIATTEEPEGTAKRFYASRDAKVRNKPTANGSIVLREIRRGEAVSGHVFQGVDATSDWLKLDGQEEYVSLANLVETQPLPLIESIKRTISAPADIELRNQPDDQAGVVISVKARQPIDVVGRLANEWIEVALPKGGVGYFRDSDGMLTEDVPAAPGFSENGPPVDEALPTEPPRGDLTDGDKEVANDPARKP